MKIKPNKNKPLKKRTNPPTHVPNEVAATSMAFAADSWVPPSPSAWEVVAVVEVVV